MWLWNYRPEGKKLAQMNNKNERMGVRVQHVWEVERTHVEKKRVMGSVLKRFYSQCWGHLIWHKRGGWRWIWNYCCSCNRCSVKLQQLQMVCVRTRAFADHEDWSVEERWRCHWYRLTSSRVNRVSACENVRGCWKSASRQCATDGCTKVTISVLGLPWNIASRSEPISAEVG